MAVEWMKPLEYKQVVFEMDCETALHREELRVHLLNHNLLLSIKDKFIINKFWFCKLIHRSRNNVAHNLAKNARVEAISYCHYYHYLQILSNRWRKTLVTINQKNFLSSKKRRRKRKEMEGF